ncbi:MAG: DUF853 family protein, partial [Clostridia bacterium]|nr:DUF853 family protein [Clostridia bacterium]
ETYPHYIMIKYRKGAHMYYNEKLLIGKNGSGEELSILPQMANRHGVITGASGSGKTITLKVMAESFSDAGVPVFLADVKGDIAGTAVTGEVNENIQKRLGITFIYVTHDQQEALSMSDTVVVMNGGKIQQIGSPIDIYNEPKNAFVADFIGESNILDGVMLDDFKAKFSGAVFQCLDKGFAVNENVDIVVRPEDVDVVPIEEGTISGVITSNTFKGVHFEMIVDIDNFKWMIQTTDYYPIGTKIGIQIEPDAIHVMKKSEYSGLYGDYSSFSDEIEHLSDVTVEEE